MQWRTFGSFLKTMEGTSGGGGGNTEERDDLIYISNRSHSWTSEQAGCLIHYSHHLFKVYSMGIILPWSWDIPSHSCDKQFYNDFKLQTEFHFRRLSIPVTIQILKLTSCVFFSCLRVTLALNRKPACIGKGVRLLLSQPTTAPPHCPCRWMRRGRMALHSLGLKHD